MLTSLAPPPTLTFLKIDHHRIGYETKYMNSFIHREFFFKWMQSSNVLIHSALPSSLVCGISGGGTIIISSTIYDVSRFKKHFPHNNSVRWLGKHYKLHFTGKETEVSRWFVQGHISRNWVRPLDSKSKLLSIMPQFLLGCILTLGANKGTDREVGEWLAGDCSESWLQPWDKNDDHITAAW